MNSQNFHQMYNTQPANGPTPEQLAAFQKQQQMFLQQQQQYMMQQQQLQKQMMREEQRNRLKNMNVKSMGASTFQQQTSMPQSHSNFSSNYSAAAQSRYQPPPNFQASQPYPSSNYQQSINPAQSINPVQSMNPMQTVTSMQQMAPIQQMNSLQQTTMFQPMASAQHIAPGLQMSSAQELNSAQSMNQMQPMAQISQPAPFQQMNPLSTLNSMQSLASAQPVAPVTPISTAKPQVNQITSNSGGWLDPVSQVSLQSNSNTSYSNADYNGVNALANFSSAGSDFLSKTDGVIGVASSTTNFQSPLTAFESKDESFNRSDSDEFGDFATSCPNSLPPLHQDQSTGDQMDIFQSATTTNGTVNTSDSSIRNIQDLFQPQTSFTSAQSVHSTSVPKSNQPNIPLSNNSNFSLGAATTITSNNFDLLQSGSLVEENLSQTSSTGLGVATTLSDFQGLAAVSQNKVTVGLSNTSVLNSSDDFDEFDDFKSAVSEPSSQVVQQSLPADYVPGSLTNENADVVYSVAMFSNPIKVENTSKSTTSEFDKLISKSLSGKSTKSDVKSLFKPAQKPTIPSMKSNVIPSEKAADWGSLNLGDMFQTPAQEDEDFGDFSSQVPESTPKNAIFDFNAPLSLVSETVENKTSAPDSLDSPSEDLFSTFTSSKPNSHYGKLPFISEATPESINDNVGLADIFGISNSKPKTKEKDTSILDLFGGNLASEPTVVKTEPSDSDWSDFTSTSNQKESSVPDLGLGLVAPVKANSSSLNMEKIPSLYKDIIEFCNTPSGIIDVGKVYELLLTDKFKVVSLQPLMSQCKMMSNPSAKDLVDLIGIVGLKQKGFPTPSKYELNYQKLSIPSVNMAVLKKNKSKQKVDNTEQPTLLSFVSQESEKKKAPSLAPVFDFGTSSVKDLSNAPFAGKTALGDTALAVSANNDDDDWGNFGSVADPVSDANFSWDDGQLADFKPQMNNNSVFDLLQEPTIPPPSKPSTTVSIPKPRSAVPLKLDEPPPLSDDDDWADFAHPAHRWDIDPDEIEEQAVNNAASKNRWGTVSTSSDKGNGTKSYEDKDYSHVEVEVGNAEDQTPNFFAADFKSRSLTPTDLPISESLSDLPDSSLTDSNAQTVDPSRIASRDEVIANNEDVFVAESGRKESSRKDMDKLASPDGDVGQFVSPFGDFAAPSSGKFDNFFESPVENLDSENTDDWAAPNFDSPFADFGNNSSEAVGRNESGDFGDFATSLDVNSNKKDAESHEPVFADFDSATGKVSEDDEFSDFCGTTEDGESTKDALTESLKLTNLPKKDLDGFWNDMVDTLGSKIESAPTDAVPVFDLGTAPEATTNNLVFIPAVKQPVSYDALKGVSFENEEDRIGAWSKCLSMILTILIQCQTLLGTSEAPSVKQEVVDSEKGKVYLDCCTEVFRVACRISVSGASDDGIVEIFKEIKHTWTLISEMLDDSIDLPNIRDFNIRSGKTEDEFTGRNCGICVLDTGVENKASKLQYNGVFYHVTCANFWVNTINPLLPNLNCKLEDPLL